MDNKRFLVHIKGSVMWDEVEAPNIVEAMSIFYRNHQGGTLSLTSSAKYVMYLAPLEAILLDGLETVSISLSRSE